MANTIEELGPLWEPGVYMPPPEPESEPPPEPESEPPPEPEPEPPPEPEPEPPPEPEPVAEIWKPDFTQETPYAGMPSEYADKVLEVFVPTAEKPRPPIPEALLTIEQKSFVEAEATKVLTAEQERLDAIEAERLEAERLVRIETERLEQLRLDKIETERLAAIEAQRLADEVWKPDFTKSAPYEGMPAEYAVKALETFIPTVEKPRPPIPEALLTIEQKSFVEAEATKVLTAEQERLDAIEAERLEEERLAKIEEDRLAAIEGQRLADAVWRPDFTKEYPYEGMPAEYAVEVLETFVPTAENPRPPIPERLLTAEQKSFVEAEAAKVVVPELEVVPEPVVEPELPPPPEDEPEPPPPPKPPEPEPVVEPEAVLATTGWHPDFTSETPWEGMPQEYVEREAAAFRPTLEEALPPSQRTPEGIAAREKAAEVSREIASIKLTRESTPDKPVFTEEAYALFMGLQDEQKFLKLVELGVIEAGSQYVPGLKVTYGEGVPLEKQVLEPREWGIYTPEQVATMAITKAEQDEVNSIIAQLGEYDNLALAIRDGKIDLVRRAYELRLFGGVVEASEGDIIKLPDGSTVSDTWFRGLPDDLQKLGLEKGKQALEDHFQTIVVGAQLVAAEIGSRESALESIERVAPTAITIVDGKPSISLEEALMAGVADSTLRLAGFKPEDVSKASAEIKEFEALVATMPVAFQEAYEAGGVSELEKVIELDKEAFEANLINLPKAFGDAYREEGYDGYNAVVAEWNTMRGEARAKHPPKGESYWISEELSDKVESDEFKDRWAVLMQPASISDEDYAKVKAFVLPSGFDSGGAYDADASIDAINKYVLANSSQEFRDKVSSGELILLPYGQPITKEAMDKLPSPTQEILNESGIVGLVAHQEQVVVNNEAEDWKKNTTDALYLATTGMVHDVYSFGLANLQGLFGDVKAGDMKEVYRYNAEITQATAIASIFMKDPPNMFYTEEEAAIQNEKNAAIRAALINIYEEAQKVRADWVASHPELQPVYPAGPLQSVKDNPAVLLDPLLYSETIANTLPYTLATMGVMVAGAVAGGPAGFVAGSTVAFAITMSVEGHGIYEDAIANGATIERARELMNTYGAMSAAVETVGDAVFLSVLGHMSKAVSSALGINVSEGVIRAAAAKYGWANLTRDTIFNFINQGAQEYVQEVIHNAAVKTVNENRPLLEGAMDAFVAGIIGTAPFVFLPAGGAAVKLITAPTAEEVASGALEISIADQAKILHQVIQPTEGFVDLTVIKDPVVARNVAFLYNDMGAKVQEYASTMLEMKQVQKGISEIGLAMDEAQADLLEKLNDKATSLQAKLDELGGPLRRVADKYADAISQAVEVDSPALLEEISKISGRILGDIDSITSQLFGVRTALVIAKDIQEIQSQIEDAEREIKGGVSLGQTVAYGELISQLNSELSTLNEEMKLRYLKTGEEVEITKKGELTMQTISLQQRLIRAAEAVAKAKEEVVVKPVEVPIAEIKMPEIDISARVGADLYDTGYAVGEAIRVAKDLPSEVILSLYDTAGVLDDAVAGAASTYRVSQLYLSQQLPDAVRFALYDASKNLDVAVARTQQAAIEAKDFITQDLPNKAVSVLRESAESLNKAVAAVKAIIARARLFVVEDIPVATANALMNAAGGIDVAISKAEALTGKVKYYLTQGLPDATVNMLMDTVKSLDDATSNAYQSVITMRELAEDKAVGILMEAAEGVDSAVARAEQTLILASKVITEKIPMATIEATRRAVEVLDAEVARAIKVANAIKTFATEAMPQASIDMLMGVAGGVDDTVAKAQLATAQARQFIIQGVPDQAVKVLMDAAVSLDTALAEANSVLGSVGKFTVETVPDATVNVLMNTAESLDSVVAQVGVVATEIRRGITTTMPDIAVNILKGTVEALENTIAQTRDTLSEARRFIAEGLPNKALEVLMEATKAMDDATSTIRTLLAKIRSGVISLPDAIVENLMDEASLMDDLSAQVRYDVGKVKGYIAGIPSNVATSIRGELYEVQQMREAFVGQLTMGVKNAVSGEARAESWVRALQEQAETQRSLQQAYAEQFRALETPSEVALETMLKKAFIERDIFKAVQEATEPIWGRADYSAVLARLNDVLDDLRERGEVSLGVFAEITRFLEERGEIEKAKREAEVKPPPDAIEVEPEITPERRAEIARIKEIAERVEAEPKPWELTPEQRAKIDADIEAAKVARETAIAEEVRIAEAKVAEAQVVAEPVAVEVAEEISLAEKILREQREELLARRVTKATESILAVIEDPVVGVADQVAVITEQAIEQGVEAYIQAITEGDTITEAQLATQQAVAELVEQSTEQAMQQATAIEDATEIEQATQVEQATEAIVQTATAVALQTATEIAIKVPAKVAVMPLVPILPVIPDAEADRARRKKEDLGKIAWKQGALKIRGRVRPQWYVISPPYKTVNDIHRQFITPRGATIVKGIGSAFKTIQQIQGANPNIILTLDMGIMDVQVTTPKKRGQKGAIKFKKDKEQKTQSAIQLKDVKTVHTGIWG